MTDPHVKIIPRTVLLKKPGSPVLIKRLLWLYIFLLIFEGALRKWFLPQLSAPLLIARDPVVLLIYFVALKDDLFPRSGFLSALWLLAVLSFFLLLIQLISLGLPLNVLFFGLRTNYLHFPLIFLIPKIFKTDDLYLLGKWVLWLSIPMAVLMAYQFRSSPDAWINRTAGTAGGFQLTSALGKIRPPGTFSFITGAVTFFSLVAAYLGFAISGARKIYPRWLVISAALALAVAMAVSGSRAMILSAGLVAVGWLLAISAARQLTAGLTRIILLLFAASFLAVQIGQVEIFKEGTEVLSTRFTAAGNTEQAKGGIAGRILDSVLAPLVSIGSVPFIGYGLGVGTNVGAALMQGTAGFLLSEGEWGRVIMEMGPVLGILFLLYRICLLVSLGKASLRCAQSGNLLALLLWSACATNIFNGQIAQPTNLGFTVLIAGLTLSAVEMVPPPAPPKPVKKKPGVKTGW